MQHLLQLAPRVRIERAVAGQDVQRLESARPIAPATARPARPSPALRGFAVVLAIAADALTLSRKQRKSPAGPLPVAPRIPPPPMTDLAHIRNFSIVAHIDHGKSTLADRLIQIYRRADQPRDEGPGARFHGYRARARHHHQGPDRPPRIQGAERRDLILNLMDTPGHVDFAYEVSRCLAACEGALLVVDAARASRPRPSPMSTRRSTPISRSCRC
jgi:hypothetical protein